MRESNNTKDQLAFNKSSFMTVSKPFCIWNYLLQIFSKPIFEEDTFFLEVIQRQGSRGFGSGNIKALALSIALEKSRIREEKP